MFKCIIAIGVMALLLSCESQPLADAGKKNAADPQTVAIDDYLKKEGDSIVIPSFSIEVALSQQANAKLISDKETIIVAAWFAGQPKDTTSKEYAESGEMFIKSHEIELRDSSRLATFEGIKFSKTKYDSLGNKDIKVLVNVFSGRKSSPDNLLDCEILTNKVSAVKGQKFVLAGKLIAESDSLSVK